MTFVYILLVLILATLVFIIFKSRQSNSASLSDDFFKKFNEKFPEVLNQANTNLVNLASQNLDTKKTAIEELIRQIQKELVQNQQKLETAERDRVGSFNGLKEAIDNNQKMTQQLKATADSLKNVLSNNQMRGAFGEKVAEDLLKQSGFVIGTDYTKQETTGESRPDFTVYLPDKTKVNIDSKFPYSNIVKMTETEDPSQKTQYLKLFESDIRKKIKDVASRDYINPEQNTVDFVIVFIPNEMIFSFIYEKFPDILDDTFGKKVILAGPFSFTAILRMIKQAYDNFHLQKNVGSIINHIKEFQKQFEEYNKSFTDLGKKIDSVSKQYDDINGTRTRQLLRVVDKIKLESPKPDQPLLPES
ncbi:MAG: DNA recombination protein RmuC [Candidatus Shapirobacteria bacterium]